MKAYPYLWLDVFTQTRFGGNPLAVVFEAQGLSTQQMQAIAREFNLSETTFVLPPHDPAHDAQVRIFTPRREIPFAGHPTLGTAFALHHWRQQTGTQTPGDYRPTTLPIGTTLLLEEGVGTIPVTALATGQLEFEVAQQPTYQPFDFPLAWLSDLLGIASTEIGGFDLPPEAVSCGLPFCLVPIRSLAAIQQAAYHWSAADPRLHSHPELQEVYLVCPQSESPGVDFHVRLFAPGVGIAEDPATGSAAAALAASLYRHRQTEGHWLLEQGLEMGRPSQLQIRLRSEQGQARIFVAGYSQLIASGQIWV